MTSGILKIFQDHKFDDTSDLPARLERLSPNEWLDFSNSLDVFYSSLDPVTNKQIASPSTFCFPSLPDTDLHRLSTYLLISDKVFMDDPLYDVVALLGGMANPEYARKTPINVHVFRQFRRELTSQVANYIAFYIRAKELVQENLLVPFKLTMLPEGADTYADELNETIINDPRLRSYLKLPSLTSLKAYGLFLGLKVRFRQFQKQPPNKILNEILETNWIEKNSLATIRLKPIMTSLAIFALYGGLQGLSIDFMTPEYAYIFRKLLETASHVNTKLPSNERLLIPASISLNGINVPLLQNIPVERVLDTISGDSLIFESFRATLNEKLLKISAPPGSVEREKQIAEIRETMNRDLANISIAYDEISRSFAKKYSFHVMVGLSSIAVAGISTIGQNLNALSLAGGILAGAGIGVSVKDFAKDWLDYQREILKLRSNENYFIWRLAQPQKH